MREFLELKLSGSGQGREEKRRHFDLAAAKQLAFQTPHMDHPEPLELVAGRPAPYGQLQPLIGRFRRGYFTPSGIPFSKLGPGDQLSLTSGESRLELDQALVVRRWAEPAVRSDWKTQSLSLEAREALPLASLADLSLTARQFKWLTLGWIPQVMEEKWFIFAEKPWLYLHRSWTGIPIFGVRLAQHGESWQVVESWGNARREQGAFESADAASRALRAVLRSRLRQMEKIWDVPGAGVS